MNQIHKLNIGIIGGGQLGKMILSESNRMSLKTSVLDSNKNSNETGYSNVAYSPESGLTIKSVPCPQVNEKSQSKQSVATEPWTYAIGEKSYPSDRFQ